ncbi:hypothetical protein LZ30DRAFT_263153 [Colletotrichum cereale]|nr:hypothetical protein LZ30DRAFT_263153 [Colletotrichum cereale]
MCEISTAAPQVDLASQQLEGSGRKKRWQSSGRPSSWWCHYSGSVSRNSSPKSLPPASRLSFLSISDTSRSPRSLPKSPIEVVRQSRDGPIAVPTYLCPSFQFPPCSLIVPRRLGMDFSSNFPRQKVSLLVAALRDDARCAVKAGGGFWGRGRQAPPGWTGGAGVVW